MQGSTAVLIVALAPLFGLFVPAQSKQASHMVLEVHEDVCAGLSSSECCAQSLEIAVFRATGDQLPKAAKVPVRLSCADPEAVVPEGACRSIAMARGFGAKDVGELCQINTLAKRCDGNATCKSCMQDLSKLKFQSAERACYAASYVPKVASTNGTKVIAIDDDKPAGVSDDGSTLKIRKRRTVVK